jgi:hypothetical protein
MNHTKDQEVMIRLLIPLGGLWTITGLAALVLFVAARSS